VSGIAPVGAPRRVIRALVVDDSAVAREVLSTVLRSEGFDVTTASNAAMAATRIEQQAPDVLLLDIEMPGQSGLDFLADLMRRAPMPVVICSGIAQPGAVAAIRALELGAVDVIPKPTLGIRALADGAGAHLGRVMRAAAAARSRIRSSAAREPVPAARGARAAKMTPVGVNAIGAWQGRAILVGASTGGTDAIRELLISLPPTSPPVVIVQHMPREYTTAFARRLNELSALHVREATDGEALAPGVALIAPGGRQMELHKVGATTRVQIHDGPPVSGHRPSVDALFHTAARALGVRAVAALLTGMGADGAEGLLALHRAGATTIAQDEATCVVFGMPKEAIALGAAQQVLPLSAIVKALGSVGDRASAARTPDQPQRHAHRERA
jgi:two-component system chemotaxis response regulator CheB